MKNISRIFTAIVLVTFAINVKAQNTSNATSQASATIITKLLIENERNLNFGTIANNVEGTVTMAADDNPVPLYSNPGMVVPAGNNNITSAKFIITGEQNYNFKMVIDESIELKNGSNEMSLTLTPSLTEPSVSLGGGTVDLYVGGILYVNQAQAAGHYSGSFNVTVTYE